MELLEEIKINLGITWDDPNTDYRVKGYIERGKSRLDKISGVALNFEEEGLAKSLLFDYCRYANSNALEMFEKNFLGELNSLRIESMVSAIEN